MPIINKQLAHEINKRAKEDQRLRRAAMRAHSNKVAAKDVWKYDQSMRPFIRATIKEYGWPDIPLVGKRASIHFWLLVQHADRAPKLQARCLKLMKEKVDAGLIEKKYYAYLHDRVHLKEDGKQYYGTQFIENERGELIPKPLRDHKNVDKRRKEFGLQPLAQYKKQLEGIKQQYERASKKQK